MTQKNDALTRIIKSLAYQFGIFTLLFYLTSCSASKKINEDLLIGSWTRNKIVSIIPKASAENYASVLDSLGLPSEVSVGNNEADRKVVIIQGRTEKSLTAAETEEKLLKLQTLFPDFKDVMVFNSDKTFNISAQKNKIDGNWKMNGKGNTITLYIQGVSAPKTLTLLNIDSKFLEVVDHFPTSDVQIGYQKK
jgi:hypothetical protein